MVFVCLCKGLAFAPRIQEKSPGQPMENVTDVHTIRISGLRPVARPPTHRRRNMQMGPRVVPIGGLGRH